MKQVIAVVFLLSFPVSGSAQNIESGRELRALVEEVRALRAELQRMSAAELRGRILLERLSLQQQVVRDLGAQVEGAKTDEGMPMTESEPMESMATDLEERLRKETNPEARRNIEREMAGMKRRREMEARHRDQWRIRNQRIEARYREEQDRLRGIEDSLERLLNEISRKDEPGRRVTPAQ